MLGFIFYKTADSGDPLSKNSSTIISWGPTLIEPIWAAGSSLARIVSRFDGVIFFEKIARLLILREAAESELGARSLVRYDS